MLPQVLVMPASYLKGTTFRRKRPRRVLKPAESIFAKVQSTAIRSCTD